MDVDSETDSNHDTALTLACAGGHEDLVELLLSRGADIGNLLLQLFFLKYTILFLLFSLIYQFHFQCLQNTATRKVSHL